ncbi:phosphatase and actin regulator 1-like isoform X4 [Branchiostoma floridae]|uniref:Phosphatase and actin regulator 1-like isoform X4 n=1 Tax=Branchiostoma floridae TaxID=7739 RepID=A0A9J7KPK6_BRAFL|nr:phosphatase and actin regulator 1-like isoform X4 [Branchiostoma floridae]
MATGNESREEDRRVIRRERSSSDTPALLDSRNKETVESGTISEADAMKSGSSLVPGSRTPPVERKSRFATLGRIFKPWKWRRKKKSEKFKQTSIVLERKISMRSTREDLVKRGVLKDTEGDGAVPQATQEAGASDATRNTPLTTVEETPEAAGGDAASPHIANGAVTNCEETPAPPLPAVLPTPEGGDSPAPPTAIVQHKPSPPIPPKRVGFSLPKRPAESPAKVEGREEDARDTDQVVPEMQFKKADQPTNEMEGRKEEEEEEKETAAPAKPPKERVRSVPSAEVSALIQTLEDQLKNVAVSLGPDKDRRDMAGQSAMPPIIKVKTPSLAEPDSDGEEDDKENKPVNRKGLRARFSDEDESSEEEGSPRFGSGLAAKVARKDSLALKLSQRPTRRELIEKNIIPSISDKERQENREVVGTKLNRRLSLRPTAEELQQRGILKVKNEEEARQEMQEKKRTLTRKLSFRPTVEELRQRAILTFNDYVEVAEAQDYDRRADKPWTRLTPKDKADIRKELNDFKSSEMEVHEESRHLTRFHRP